MPARSGGEARPARVDHVADCSVRIGFCESCRRTSRRAHPRTTAREGDSGRRGQSNASASVPLSIHLGIRIAQGATRRDTREPGRGGGERRPVVRAGEPCRAPPPPPRRSCAARSPSDARRAGRRAGRSVSNDRRARQRSGHAAISVSARRHAGVNNRSSSSCAPAQPALASRLWALAALDSGSRMLLGERPARATRSRIARLPGSSAAQSTCAAIGVPDLAVNRRRAATAAPASTAGRARGFEPGLGPPTPTAARGGERRRQRAESERPGDGESARVEIAHQIAMADSPSGEHGRHAQAFLTNRRSSTGSSLQRPACSRTTRSTARRAVVRSASRAASPAPSCPAACRAAHRWSSAPLATPPGESLRSACGAEGARPPAPTRCVRQSSLLLPRPTRDVDDADPLTTTSADSAPA